MTFLSTGFFVFFAAVAGAYYLCPHRFRWALLLAASYLFYASFRAPHLAVLGFTTAVTYATGLAMGAAAPRSPRRRAWLFTALALDLGALLVFKYLGLFGRTADALLSAAGIGCRVPAIELALPVGISFYTFQALGYSIDVYRGDRPAERHLGLLALYCAFFPQLLSGPIERSTRLLPQLLRRVTPEYDRIASGMSLVLLGIFKKVVIADRLALYADEVFAHPAQHQGAPAVLAVYAFTVQIYCDFAGYSDMAIGLARILGFDLMANFERPYGARTITEFWRRWHISLSSWFRDYLYKPLGGNRCAKPRWLANLMIVFVVSGLWHGASWTFVAWGGLHGAYAIAGALTAGPRARIAEALRLTRGAAARVHDVVRAIVVFHLVAFAWIFFKAATFEGAIAVVRACARGPFRLADLPLQRLDAYELAIAAVACALLFAYELAQARRKWDGFLRGAAAYVRWPIYVAAISAILVFGVFGVTTFIYVQF